MKTDINHILLPTDFSGYSTTAFKYALHLADAVKARITLLHVVEPPYNLATAVEGMLQMMEKNAVSRLEQMIKEVKESRFKHMTIELKVTHGRTAREILLQIKELQADIVVMGSKGQSGLQRMVFGSVSAAIVADSPVAVFVLPSDDTLSDPVINNIVFATTLREKDPDNLQFVHSIASLTGASVRMVYITKENDFDSSLRVKGFRQIIRELHLDPSPELTVTEHDNVMDGLAEFLAKYPDSLIALNRYKRSLVQKLFGSNHTDEVLEYSNFPLLILPCGK